MKPHRLTILLLVGLLNISQNKIQKPGEKLWEFDAKEWIISSPAVINNMVYFGCADGAVYCLDATTGKIIWRYQTEKYIYASPALSNNKVVIASWDRKVYCLDAKTGKKLWDFLTPG
jgi:outer membrane protein assembly factor BamB